MSEFTSRTQKDIAELYQSIYDKQEKDSTEYILQERDAILNEECVEEEVNIEDDLDKLVNYLVSSGHVITEDQAINIIPSMSDSWMEYIIEQGRGRGVYVPGPEEADALKRTQGARGGIPGRLNRSLQKIGINVGSSSPITKAQLDDIYRQDDLDKKTVQAAAARDRGESGRNFGSEFQVPSSDPAKSSSDTSASTSTPEITPETKKPSSKITPETKKPSNVISATNTAGNKQKVTVGRKYAATYKGKAGNVTYDASGKRTWNELEKPKSASTSPAPKVQTAQTAQTAPAPKVQTAQTAQTAPAPKPTSARTPERQARLDQLRKNAYNKSLASSGNPNLAAQGNAALAATTKPTPTTKPLMPGAHYKGKTKNIA